jgi:hypothetical protein
MSVQVIYTQKTTSFRFYLSHAPTYGTSQRQPNFQRPGQGTSRPTKRHLRAPLEPRGRPLGYIQLISDLRGSARALTDLGLAPGLATVRLGLNRTLERVLLSATSPSKAGHQNKLHQIHPLPSPYHLGRSRGATSDSGSQPRPLAIDRATAGRLLSFLGSITERR